MSVFSARELGAPAIETHTAIIGSGAAGLTLASKLNEPAIVIESGGFSIDERLQGQHHAVSTGERTYINSVRLRAIGGATSRWTGRCAELDPYDFEDRPWMDEYGWPVTLEDLRPAYDRAWQSLRIAQLDKNAIFERSGIAGWARRAGGLKPYLWHYAYRGRDKYLHFGREHRGLFKGGNKHLMFAADCVELVSSGREVSAARIVDRAGRSVLVKAKRFVVASGCVETSRLLQVSGRSNPELLGEAEHWLGRGFMQHLRVKAGTIAATPLQFRALQRAINRFPRANSGAYDSALVIDTDLARREQLGNATMIMRYTPDWRGETYNVVPVAIDRALGRGRVFPKGRVDVEIETEQVVDRESRIGLSERVDVHGMPRADVRWKIADTDRKTAVRMMDLLGNFLKVNELGQHTQPAGLGRDSIDANLLVDSNHHLGGARMGDSARTGVVDRNLKVHGTANLWAVGGSVFATGGHVNPTLTIVALALRLADYLSFL